MFLGGIPTYNDRRSVTSEEHEHFIHNKTKNPLSYARQWNF